MTTAKDIMNSDATCVGEGQTLAEAAQMMRELGVGSLPISGKDGRLIGMLTDRDIVVNAVATGKDLATCTAGELAQGKVCSVDSATDIDAIVEQMGSEQIKRMPVMEGAKLVGMISESDLARHVSQDHLSTFVEKVYGRN